MSLGIPLNLQPFSGVNQEYVDRLNQYAQQVMPNIHYRCPKGYSHNVNQLQLPADPAAFGLDWNVDRNGHLCYPRSGLKQPSMKSILKAAQMAQAFNTVTGQQLSPEQLAAVMAMYKGGKRSRSRSPSLRQLSSLAGLAGLSGLAAAPTDTASVRSELSGLVSAQQETLAGLTGGASPAMTFGGQPLQVTQEAIDLSAKIVQAAEQQEAKIEQEKQAADIIRLTKIVKKHNPLLSEGDAAVQAMNMYKESVNCTQYIGKPGDCDASGECHTSSSRNSTMCLPKSLHERQQVAKLQQDAKKESTELNSWFRSYNSKQKKIGYGVMAPLAQAAEIEKVAAILRKYRDANVDVSDEAQSIVSSASVCSGPDGAMSGACGKLSLSSSVAYPQDLLDRRVAVDMASDVGSQTKDLSAWYRAFYAREKARKK